MPSLKMFIFFILIPAFTICIKPVSTDNNYNNANSESPYVIDLNSGSPIEETEALIKQSFALWEQMIIWATGNASLLAQLVSSGQGAQGQGPAVSISIGNVMARAFLNRPIFRLPTNQSFFGSKNGSTTGSRLSAPMCGYEIQQLACSLIGSYNDGRVFLSPFDLDELVSKDRQGSTPWHRNSPLVSMVRLCSGLKASTKYESTETCIGAIVLDKLKDLIAAYSDIQQSVTEDEQSDASKTTKSSAASTLNDNGETTTTSVLSYGDRYLTIKAILKNYGYTNQGTAADHSTGNGVDILCGPSAGTDSGAEKNCTTIKVLCQDSSSSNTMWPAETTGCGAAKSPLTSVHCAFFQRPVINLVNMTATDVTEAVRQHYEQYEKQAKTTLTDVVSNAVETAVQKNLTVAETVTLVKTQLAPKIANIIMDAREHRIIVNVSSMPRRNYPVQFKRIGFRIAQDNNVIDNMLVRNTRATSDQLGLQCPLESVEMAKKLIEMNNFGEKIYIVPNLFSSLSLSYIVESISNGISRSNSGTPAETATPQVNSSSDAPGKRFIPSAKAALRLLTAQIDNTTPSQTTQKSDAETRSPNPFDDIVRMSLGQKAINSNGSLTCISYEVLNGIYNMANSFYENHQQLIYIAALSATPFHASSPESATHNGGIAVDTLCGIIYPRNSASSSPVGDETKLYCSELAGSCFQTKMFTRVVQGGTEKGGSNCLTDSIYSMYGIVHCRSREVAPTTSSP